MDRSGWSYVSGLVSAQWERLMPRRALIGVLQAGSADERRARLRASLLFADSAPGERSLDEIEPRFEAIVRRLASLAPDERIGDFFLLAREWRAFRGYVKGALGRRAGTSGPGGGADAGRHDRYEAFLRGEADDPRHVGFAEAGRRASSLLRAEDAMGRFDLVADSFETRSYLAAVEAVGSQPLTEWVGSWAMMRAALAILRARRNEWPVGEVLQSWREAGFDDPALREAATGDDAVRAAALRRLGLTWPPEASEPAAQIIRLDRMIDDHLTELAAGASGVAFGPERVFAFLWALRNESLNLRIVLAAAESGMAEERVMADLRTGPG